ncbi:hypothetical protein BOX37_09365 [Nocardia mangyaensis]|uniref:Uncharacterized protein n=1 Tax=Nocardia mangyaensis TaxID=2213200 RepID=A0A1J0VQ17_9NOCA|nr:hypothetical protein BOX37_09365 [Nocardia mangyaensis]
MVLSATGCADKATEAVTSTTESVTTTVTAPSSRVAPTSAPPTAEGSAFDVESVPLAQDLPGTFPYFTLPAGFENPNRDEPVRPRDRVPIWTGDRLEWVIGKVSQSYIHADEDHAFSKFALIDAIDTEVAAAGGSKITESKVPEELVDTIDEDLLVGFNAGLGGIYSQTVNTYLIRTEDRRVWIHLTADSASGHWLIAEELIETTTTK